MSQRNTDGNTKTDPNSQVAFKSRHDHLRGVDRLMRPNGVGLKDNDLQGVAA
jgi:hypothetical protein